MGAKNMSSVALKLYQGLTDAGEDKEKAKIFATAFEELEQRYPEVKDLATGVQLTETSLLLQKEMQENKIEMLKSMSQQTWHYFTGLSILAVILTSTTALLVHYLK